MKKLVFIMKSKEKVLKKLKSESGAIAWEYLAVAAVILIVVAFVIAPYAETFATGVTTKMNTWWSSISNSIFATS